MNDTYDYVSNDVDRTISMTAFALVTAASAVAFSGASDYLHKKYVDCSYESLYPTRTLCDVDFVKFDSYLPHEIKEFIDSIGLSESDVMGISCIAKKTFSNPSISYAVDVDEDDVKYLSVTIFDDSDDVNEKDSHIESFYKAVNFDKRWQNFFSKSVVYFK